MTINPPTANFAWPTLEIDAESLLALTKAMTGVEYGWGWKAKSLDQDPSRFVGTKQGDDEKKVDCSGFTRFAIYKLTGLAIPDGSVSQREWVEANGFKHSTYEDAMNHDNVVRIAFLSPSKTSQDRHVMLIVNGATCESHGHLTGVDRRVWGSCPWMKDCHVYVLSLG